MLSGIRKSLPKVRVWQWFAVALLSIAVLGCGEGSDPNLTKLGGKVVFDGRPLEAGTINFASKDGATGTAAIGDGGRYTVSLAPGDYQVAIEARAGAPTMDKQGRPVPAQSLIPEQYGDITTSGLTATVERGKKEINFDLKP